MYWFAITITKISTFNHLFQTRLQKTKNPESFDLRVLLDLECFCCYTLLPWDPRWGDCVFMATAPRDQNIILVNGLRWLWTKVFIIDPIVGYLSNVVNRDVHQNNAWLRDPESNQELELMRLSRCRFSIPRHIYRSKLCTVCPVFKGTAHCCAHPSKRMVPLWLAVSVNAASGFG